MRPTKAIINLNRLNQNIANLKALIRPETSFMAVVKANAYGHGAVPVAKSASKAGADWLGVALPEEGAELRENGVELPILVLGEVSPEQSKTVLRYDLTQAIPSIETARHLNLAAKQYGKRVKVHLKLDTGMGRIGFRSISELEKAADELSSMEFIEIEGAFTHFASADEEDPSYTTEQIEKLDNMLKALKNRGIGPNIIHASNSAGVFHFPNANYNMVRCGISIYGYYPSERAERLADARLLPILQWETHIAHIKTIEAGCSISYGRTYTASCTRRVATLPVGYADGYNRLLGNKAFVLVNGKKAPVIGRVCMDQIMIDITDIPDAIVGDPVVLLGEQGTESITAEDLAKLCGTISYEILTSISERVPRVYVET
ncbi:MAG TPA: alanine racemase [Clostridiales bacterium]|nr:alanine racemase [Clostridiales bacterium]